MRPFSDPDFQAACRRMTEDVQRLTAGWAAAVSEAMKAVGKANTPPR